MAESSPPDNNITDGLVVILLMFAKVVLYYAMCDSENKGDRR